MTEGQAVAGHNLLVPDHMTTLPSATSYFKYNTCIVTSSHNLATHALAKQNYRKSGNFFRKVVQISGPIFLDIRSTCAFPFFSWWNFLPFVIRLHPAKDIA